MLKPLILVLALLAGPAFSVQPDEVLADPVLEARAREISKVLRCPVCQGENIDDSNAAVSRDLRLVVRERLVAGDADWQVLDYIVARYGEYVLFEPEAKGVNLILYLTGPVALLLAMGGAAVFLRRRRQANAVPAERLSADESRRLEEILRE
ncbi:MAG: cytochrome c-type biogenesis protein CcmH [Rhodobacteraceae bacterium]|nr:cytochrome c-type biogenesis protein CcmH [Paracoccaceae bacterium]